MLLATPKEIIGKMKYENGKPTATCELTEEEQKVLDEFCKVVEREKKNRFRFEDEC
jgi:hypothetical protein